MTAFRSHGDVKAIFTRNPFVFPYRRPSNNIGTTVVISTVPGNATRIDAQLWLMDLDLSIRNCKEICYGNPNDR